MDAAVRAQVVRVACGLEGLVLHGLTVRSITGAAGIDQAAAVGAGDPGPADVAAIAVFLRSTYGVCMPSTDLR